MLRLSTAAIGYEGQSHLEAAAAPVPNALDLEQWLQLEPAETPALSFVETIETGEYSYGQQDLYDELLLRCGATAAHLCSMTGAHLPSVPSQILEKIFWEDSDTQLGALARQAEISVITGCWSIPDTYRNLHGYPETWHPEDYGIEARGSGRGRSMKLHQVAYILRMNIECPGYRVPKGYEQEHDCRNVEKGGCINPFHNSIVSSAENKQLQHKARYNEDALYAGQIILGTTGVPEIDFWAEQAEHEDTGIIASTRFGPLKIIKVDADPLVVRAEPLEDEVFADLKPLATKADYVSGEDLTKILNGQLPPLKPKRKSTAQIHKPLDGQEKMFSPLKYRKHKTAKTSPKRRKVEPAHA